MGSHDRVRGSWFPNRSLAFHSLSKHRIDLCPHVILNPQPLNPYQWFCIFTTQPQGIDVFEVSLLLGCSLEANKAQILPMRAMELVNQNLRWPSFLLRCRTECSGVNWPISVWNWLTTWIESITGVQSRSKEFSSQKKGLWWGFRKRSSGHAHGLRLNCQASGYSIGLSIQMSAHCQVLGDSWKSYFLGNQTVIWPTSTMTHKVTSNGKREEVIKINILLIQGSTLALSNNNPSRDLSYSFIEWYVANMVGFLVHKHLHQRFQMNTA